MTIAAIRTMSQQQTPNDDEQYRIAIELYDNELSRFYNRQTLYLGLQLAALAGLFAAVDKLSQNPGLTRLAMFVMFAVSVLTTLVSIRGLHAHRLLLHLIVTIEQRSQGRYDLLAVGQRFSHQSFHLNYYYAIAMNCLLVLAWLTLILWIV